jgi:hypothetical protein
VDLTSDQLGATYRLLALGPTTLDAFAATIGVSVATARGAVDELAAEFLIRQNGAKLEPVDT